MKALDALQLPLRGRCLIEASAGTGKTYTITTLVLRLLLESKLELSEILVVTYTRAATAELKERIRSRVGRLHAALSSGISSDDPLVDELAAAARARSSLSEDTKRVERALYASDDAAIFTIHGFCQRVLTDFAFEAQAPLDFELLSHSEGLIAEIAHDYWTRITHQVEPDVYERLRAIKPAGFASLIARTAHGQLPHVVPATVARPRPESASMRRALRELREQWQHGRDGLEQTLSDSKLGIKSKRFAQLCTALEPAFEQGKIPLDDKAHKALQSLTEKLREKACSKGKPFPAHPLLSLCEALYEADLAQREWLNEHTVAILTDAIEYARSELDRRTRERSSATFDQLLTRTQQALEGPHGHALVRAVRGRYRAALIDEFQDTDPLQYEIFTRALGGGPLLLIGDPKQAIYGFRGADVFAYLRARDDAGDAVYTMRTNYRSDPSVIAGLNHLYAASELPFALRGIHYEPVQARPGALDRTPKSAAVQLLWTECVAQGKTEQAQEISGRIATDIVEQLTRTMGSEAPRARDIAVLCRTNRQATLVQQALSERGVPSVLHGDSSVFETPDALELERLLASMADPHDAGALRSALSGLYVGLTAQAMDALDEHLDDWERHHAHMLDWHRLWKERGFMQAVRACLRTHQVDARLLQRTDGSRRWTNLQHLIELLQDASVRQRLGPAGVLRWLRTMRTDVAKRAELVGETAQLRLESNHEAVTLTTVHRSKGLEYPIVYCPFLWDGKLLRGDDAMFPTFHDDSPLRRVTLDLGSKDREAHKQRAREEALSEALRLVYVALTRAKHSVRVVHGPLVDAHTGPLQHLLAPEAGKEDSERLRERLVHLARTSGGSIELRDLPPPGAARYSPPHAAAPSPLARRVRRRSHAHERTSSFSALTHERPESAEVDEGQDRDAIDEAPAVSPRGPDQPPVTLHAFPRGAAAGTLVHELLESVSFDAPRETLAEAARQLLPARGLEAHHADALGQGLHEALHTSLDDSALTLAQVAEPDRVVEMEFLFRVAPDQPLDGRALARVLRRHGAPSALPSYAERVGDLPFSALRGYLRGFIDLVFRHEERFYVVDYKSNFLGDGPAHYAPDQLAHAMAGHHYYLQYLLYTVALHRHLGRRLAGYEYEQHMGGVYYLFLRGMAPHHPAGCGVFHDRPSRDLIEQLDTVLGRAEGASP